MIAILRFLTRFVWAAKPGGDLWWAPPKITFEGGALIHFISPLCISLKWPMRASPKVPFGRSCQGRCTRSTTTATARRPVFLLITWNFISRRFPCHILCQLLLGQNRQILKTRVGCVFTSPFEQVIFSPLRRLLAQNSWNEEDHTDYDCAVGGLLWYLLHQKTLLSLSVTARNVMWSCSRDPNSDKWMNLRKLRTSPSLISLF